MQWLSTSGRLRLADDGEVYLWDGERHRRLGRIGKGAEVEGEDERDLRVLLGEWNAADDAEDLRAEARSTFCRGLST